MRTFLLILFCCSFQTMYAQDATVLVNRVKAKLDLVNDYTAEGKMKTDVAFIKAPIGKIKVFFRKPDFFKLQKDGGISILPKGGISINMRSLLTTDRFLALDAGTQTTNGQLLRIIKLLPTEENSDVVLTTLYIDEAALLIKRAISTTRENGTYEIEMQYGNYRQYALPDKVFISFQTKDYKLPKGVTLEFSDEAKPKTEAEKLKNRKGRIEITYSSYTINRGIADAVFK
ncbi:MAG: LolA family protein [Bacteroidota bacterium]|jgi:outer membrane lipoprotein-sorting protein